MVDRREYRHPLARRPARGLADLAAARSTSSPNAGGDRISIRTPDVRQQHPVAVRRQPAEGAVRARARLRRQDHPDGRSDARRRHRHQARGLRPHPRRGAARAAPSSGTRPRPTSSTIATTSTCSATAASSPISDRGELTEEKVIQSSFQEAGLDDLGLGSAAACARRLLGAASPRAPAAHAAAGACRWR